MYFYYDYLLIEQETLCKGAILQFQSIAAAVAKAVHNKFTFTDNLFQYVIEIIVLLLGTASLLCN